MDEGYTQKFGLCHVDFETKKIMIEIVHVGIQLLLEILKRFGRYRRYNY